MIILIICNVLKILAVVVPLLISVAYFTIAERKIMGSIQRRRGPNVIGYLGLLQPLADGLKLFVKETILPSSSNIIIFILRSCRRFNVWFLLDNHENSSFKRRDKNERF